MIRKTRAMKETGARYAASDIREVNIAGRHFQLRHATPAQIKLLRRDFALYDKFAKHLEDEHKGEFVAIGLDGALIVDPSRARVLHQAADRFGAGKFSLLKIGYDYVLKWRRL